MRKILFALVAFSLSISAFAQLNAPNQIDTLWITGVEYNYDTVKPENWPFKYIVKDSYHFEFGQESFSILEVSNRWNVVFKLKGKDGVSELMFKKDSYEKTCIIWFSGYRFECAYSCPQKHAIEEKKVTSVDAPDDSPYQLGKSNAHLIGRRVDGNLVQPKSSASGVVVVSIWVDIYGNVTKAVPGAPGTTIDDATLWNEARDAALRTHFTKAENTTADTPQLQEGTITYIFQERSHAVEEKDMRPESIPFLLVEEKPKFRGGDADNFSKWVNSKLKYPKLAKENGVQGRVMLKFVVDADGQVRDVTVLRGVDPSVDAEAVRVVSKSPKWTPGKQRGRDVSVAYTFPVIFQLR